MANNMHEYIEFTLNGTEYTVSHATFLTGYCWSNGDEEGELFPTALEAQQDAIKWESERQQRYEESGDADRDAYWAHVNQQIADARGK